MQVGTTGLTRTEDRGDEGGQPAFWRQTWGGSVRAVLGSFTAIVFGVVILMASIMAVTNPTAVFPHDVEDIVEHADEATLKVEYYLPYPGVLPDSPLYKLKAVRDRVQLWLTFAPEEKARKELLFADKRINAAVFLVEGGKEALGVTTATKAEKYLESAANRIVGMAGEGRDVKSLLGTLVTASAKHLEILGDLETRVAGERSEAIGTAWETTKVVHERVEQALLESN